MIGGVTHLDSGASDGPQPQVELQRDLGEAASPLTSAVRQRDFAFASVVTTLG
jgi:hypothetical protein